MKAAFDQNYVKKLQRDERQEREKTSTNWPSRFARTSANFKKKNKLDRMVMVWCGSTEVFMKPERSTQRLEKFEKAMKANHPAIAPSMLYAYAADDEEVPYANGAPNLTRGYSRSDRVRAGKTTCPSSAKISRPGRR